MTEYIPLETYVNPKSPISEAYRVLRTNIQYSSFDTPLKSVVITSSIPGEGKTTTVSNLAITFAQLGSKVLLIDADLRKPKIHKIFSIENHCGLTNILVNRDDYKKYINKSAIENLDIITCGVIPPNPSELLTSNAMRSFIQKTKEDYDIVFLDSPPIGTVTDAAIISTIVDGTILVAASGVVDSVTLLEAKEQLDKVNANIIGVVLNKVDKNSQGKYYYYQYYYYGDSDDSQPHQKIKRKKRKRIKNTSFFSRIFKKGN